MPANAGYPLIGRGRRQPGRCGLRHSGPGLPDDIINFQHDPLACAVALGWDGVVVEELPLAIELRDGWLRARMDPAGRPLHVVTAVDGPRFNAFWLDLVRG